ncbi:hypothetical protein [Candidatus Nitrosocosmicus franklandus]|uniref:Uncharacterized protein n=1 Tax=Candidatus Nitrosocosmicus franklandianus TaxID=1798806 RepID=A0A484I451_9ARCH|nr:hypothetical protein [Candidatus Nitrosocosmicus franklandus]VFJ12536.1 conserved exported protein of unknown function [Candidatus Nitrosocosmicus franklandus]
MDKKISLSIMSIFVAAVLVGSVVAISSTIDNKAFAGGDDHDKKKKKKSNEAAQGIAQSTLTGQDSACGSNDDTIASCNNLAFSINLNDGNNALGQQ